jgi:hypothetical protein
VSLKHKNEAAFLKVIQDGGLFAGQRLTSEENQLSTISKPCVAAFAKPASSRPSSSGGPTGQDTWLVDIVLRSHADKQPADTVNPEDTHRDNVDAIKASIIVGDLRARLTAAQSDYSVLHVMQIASAQWDAGPKARELNEVWSFRVVAIEADCD